jgi:predicted house-cleaning NTP pyrophosphatase (Maf/HAM1 superfamily)
MFSLISKREFRVLRRQELALVKDNAFKKAQQVARQVKSGIIIGADTITVQGRNIFGKPKNIKQAKQAVKKLSA